MSEATGDHDPLTLENAALRGRIAALESDAALTQLPRDITDRIRLEERALIAQRVQVLLDLNQMTEASFQEITDFALEEAVRVTRSTIGYLAFLSEDETVLTMHSWSRSATAGCAITDKPIVCPVASSGLWGEAVRQRRPVVTNDHGAESPPTKGCPPGRVAVARHMSVPVFAGPRMVLVAGVGNKAEPYDEGDVQQLTLLMEGMWRLIERKRSHAALQTETANLEAVFESSPVAMMVLDSTTNIVKANAAAVALCGGSESEVLQHRPGNALRCVHSSRDPRGCGYSPACKLCAVRNGIEALLDRGGSMHGAELALELVRDDQPRTVWLRVGAEPLVMNGRRHLCVALEDFSERKRADEALRDSELKYRALFETAEGAILLFADGRWVDCNARASSVFGCTREQLIGAHPSSFSPALQPDGRSSQEEAVKLITLACTVGPQSFEWEHCRADGTTFAAEVSLNRVDLAGKPHIQAIVRDITERKQAEADREHLEAQLRQSQKLEAVGQLAGGVAHDFNNLLSVILCSGSFARESSFAAVIAEDLEAIQSAGERAQALTRHLLAYSRKQVLEPRILDLSHLVRDTEKLLRRVVPEHITLCTALAPDVGHVAADPGQLEQVLVNLVINARDAMPQGGRLTVETANAQVDRLFAREHLGLLEGPCVVLTVSDTGCGMDSATLARIFEPFFTTKAVGQGTGLGLSTVYGIVKQSGGHVWAESEPGRGSVFKVYLPVVHADATSCGEVLSHGWMLARPGESVLLVEDDPDVRATAVRALEFLGYKVLAADGLLAATAHLVTLERPLDLLLTDVVMPGASGPQVAQELRRRQPGLRTLFMSGYLDEVVTSRVPLPAGAAFLDKPFTLKTLGAKVREVLDAPPGA